MYIVADIGGTKTRVAASRDLQSFESPEIFDTIVTYEDGLQNFIDRIRTLAAGETIDRIAIGIPGTPLKDRKSTFISGMCALKDWSNRSIAETVESALHTKVEIENDTALVGLGEAASGAGVGAAIVTYITVSTGVGGVRIVDQRIDRVARGSEMGGQYLSMSPRRTLEELVSGAAIHEKYGVSPRDLGMESPVWEELAETFAFGLYNSIVHWSPERVVLGGSMFNEIGISVERVQAHLAEINVKMPELPEIAHSTLGDFGGLYGGLARLKQLT